MSHRPPEKATFINPLPVKDLLVSGKELGLPMVDYISANHRYSAGRMSWHSHEGHEILLLLSGSTGYEFRGGRKLQLQGGEILVIPSGTMHRGQKDVRQPSTLCAIIFDPSHQSRHGLFTKRECEWLDRHFEQRTPHPVPMNAGTRHLAKTLHALIRQHAAGNKTEGLLAAQREEQIALHHIAAIDRATGNLEAAGSLAPGGRRNLLGVPKRKAALIADYGGPAQQGWMGIHTVHSRAT
jgi:mannose-6-phosphate isomerase-like protein (cupin superfamily)